MPLHDLAEVQRLVCDETAVTFGRRLGVDVVRALFDVGAVDAEAFIRDRVLSLRPEHFAHTLTNQPPPADVYGLEYEGRGWYIKVTIHATAGRHLAVISCHPPTDPLRTRAGTIRR